ncbi:heme exporter protein D [Neorhizobium galegae]|uniref:heme exporter protein CcmD n=1 Tax=Neorhizobium galegae TaxID=399 RepID=UPI001AE4D1A4|nr:heme exporter protein CcmD [Neorhizobium galegae]MBP2562745.1 heme exporter protein D [Neorhizobium galegae]MDQ0137318.1 heme exporter protein D [Neorhizobium galegae]
MSHTFYIAMSYAVSAIVILCLIAWTWLDGRARQKELAELEASGIRRRSAQAKGDAA